MDVLVTGRHCQIPDEFRERVEDKMASIEKLKDRVIRAEVQVTADTNKRPAIQSTKVEITLVARGPVIRAEATADDKNVAFDQAFDRLKSQLRRASDRRTTRRGLRAQEVFVDPGASVDLSAKTDDRPDVQVIAGMEVHGDGPLVVREKHFDAVPLTLAQALDEMELVGHDFFLYVDAETGAPSVVYRRKAYDYGVIHLSITDR